MATYIFRQVDGSSGVSGPGVYTYNGKQGRYKLVTCNIDAYMDGAWQRAHNRALVLTATLEAMLEQPQYQPRVLEVEHDGTP